MSIKKLLIGLVVVPTMMIGGCKKDGDKIVEYSETSQEETVAFLNQIKESENFNIDGYSFKVEVAIPKMTISNNEEAWPDTSDVTKWDSVKMDGVIVANENSFEAKYKMDADNEIFEFYVKDNVAYMNDGTNKYKATFDSMDEMEEFKEMQYLPKFDNLLEQIEIVCDAKEGLKFEKGQLDGKDYYHITGIVNIDDGVPGFSINMEMPVDLYLTFENDKLISYKYKTIMLFICMEFEVETYNGEIEFPSDLDTYIENKEAII